jgi:hemolysin III
MKNSEGIRYYSPIEEKINIYSHAVGFILSIVGSVFLIIRANFNGYVWGIVSFSIFGLSLIILYAASSLYHCTEKPELRHRFKIFDHASIYILIAGTYTPFTLVTLHGSLGWVLFGISWGMALTGIILKLFFTGKYTIISTAMYVLMGWLIIFAINPLIINLSIDGFLWLFAGGMAYTLGAILYCIKKIKFNHATFHILVLIGSFCHYISVYFFVLPAA